MIPAPGMSLSGVFGLPPRAHPDDVYRSLQAAAELDARLKQLGMQGNIGVSSGRCGVFGNESRREYSLFGDALTLASRLSTRAETSFTARRGAAHQPSVPGPPLNGPRRSEVIQPRRTRPPARRSARHPATRAGARGRRRRGCGTAAGLQDAGHDLALGHVDRRRVTGLQHAQRGRGVDQRQPVQLYAHAALAALHKRGARVVPDVLHRTRSGFKSLLRA